MRRAEELRVHREAGRKGLRDRSEAIARAEAAERERDEARAEVERLRELLAEARGYMLCADCSHPHCNQCEVAGRIDAALAVKDGAR